MPDSDLYATKIDGPIKNANGTQCGDRAALFQWLKEQSQKDAIFIISLDQLLSGGLMNSRCMTAMESFEMQDGSVISEYDVIDYLSALAERKTVYVIDSVLRLACSSGYGGYTLRDYNATRTFGILSRPILIGDDLSVDRIIENYLFFADGSEIELSPDGDSLLTNYLKVRERKLRLVDYAVRTLCGRKNVHFLLGVDDSFGGNSIQTNEIHYFQQYFGENDCIYSALDGLAQEAMAQTVVNREGPAVRVSVSCFGDGKGKTGIYNFMPVSELIDKELGNFHTVLVDEQPDVDILVLTSCTSKAVQDYATCQMISKLNENDKNQIPSILIDLSTYDKTAMVQMLESSTRIGALLSCLGRTDRVGAITMTIAHGLGRYYALQNGDLPREAHISHLRNMLSYLCGEDYLYTGYTGTVNSVISSYQASPSNFSMLSAEDISAINQVLTDSVSQASEALLENVMQYGFLTDLTPYSISEVTNIEITECSFPWNRTSEIDCRLFCDSDITSPAEEPTFHMAYIDGVGRNRFSPNQYLTRAQAAKMVVCAAEIPVDPHGASIFKDTPGWSVAYVNAAYRNGVIRGFPDGTFHGDQNITRAEFASILRQYAISFGLSFEPVQKVSFSDVPRESKLWYKKAVYLLSDAGIISGYKDHTFRPNNPITRAEAVTMINRIMGRTASMTEEISAIPAFSDVKTDAWYYRHIQEASISHLIQDQ